jgi:hypothetical protein
MRPFSFEASPARVVFGFGTLSQIPAEVERLGLKRALVLATPQQADEAETLSATLGGRSAGTFAEATMHTPVGVTAEAMRVVVERDVDGVIAVGGGSTTGLAKAIALRTDLPQIVVPTTYAGSEMTPILGETKDGLKTTQRSPKVLPEVVIYDVDLTLTLPVGLSGTSGINAIAHAVEALYAQDRNPVISLLSAEGIRAPDHRRVAGGSRGALGRALRRLALRHGARRRRHGAAPQALPHARRHLRPAACRNPHGGAAARPRLQRAGRARCRPRRGGRARGERSGPWSIRPGAATRRPHGPA